MTTALIALALGLIAAATMVKVVQPEGDHASFLVMAPYPTLRWAYRGGEEGAWERARSGKARPWWISGSYWVILEITDS